MTLPKIFTALLLFCSLCPFVAAAGQEPDYRFAEKLFGQKDYYRAMVEYQRVYFALPAQQARYDGIMRAAECLYLGGQFAAARTELALLPEENYRHRKDWLFSFSYSAEQNFNLAIAALPANGGIYSRYQQTIWQMLMAADQKSPSQAATFDFFSNNFDQPVPAELELPLPWPLLQQKLQNLQGKKLAYRNPWLAAFMSAAVPGLGQLYAQRPADGLSSFLVVTALAAITLVAVNRAEYPTAWLFGGLSAVFYAGNVYGGYRAAENFNRQEITHRQNEIQELSLRYRVLSF